VLETYNDQQWLYNFVNLCRELEPHLKPNECFIRAQVDVKKQVAIAIYLLLIFETFLPFEISFQLKIHTLRLKPCKRIANIHVHTSVDLVWWEDVLETYNDQQWL
jgi:hypothetical protein